MKKIKKFIKIAQSQNDVINSGEIVDIDVENLPGNIKKKNFIPDGLQPSKQGTPEGQGKVETRNPDGTLTINYKGDKVIMPSNTVKKTNNPTIAKTNRNIGEETDFSQKRFRNPRSPYKENTPFYGKNIKNNETLTYKTIDRSNTVGSPIDSGFYAEEIFRATRDMKGAISPQEQFDIVVENDPDLTNEQCEEIATMLRQDYGLPVYYRQSK